MQPEGEWVKVRGVITPGGDPLWKCSVCGGDEHVMGIETSYNQHHECKECGSINSYPWGDGGEHHEQL